MLKDFDLEPTVAPLLQWFMENARSLPWRESPTPYHVWISEIMLQQTRVEAVKPYYAQFLNTLPDVAALSRCPQETLLKLWEGLGYYNRVRNMQQAAIEVMEKYGGTLPADYEKLRSLKGIGNYTAGAISSIAYGIYVPAVDGNVLRVLTRLTADDTDIMKQSFRSQAEAVLSALMRKLQKQEAAYPHVLHKNLAGTLNQALMELGATVCLPNGEPLCDSCPWKELCLARKLNQTKQLPVKSKAKARRIEKRTVFVIRRGSQVALHRRPDSGLLAGLYELPNIEGHYSPGEIRKIFQEQNLAIASITSLTDAKHIFSHIEWHMAGYAVQLSTEPPGHSASVSQKQEAALFPNSDELLFVETDRALRDFAIPSAFSAYAKYLDFMN